MVSFDLLQYQNRAACFSFRVLKIQIRRDSIHYFQRSFGTLELRIPMDDEISILLFCHSLDSRFWLLLRLMNVLLECRLSGHAAEDSRLGLIRDGSDGAVLLLRLL